VLFFFFFLNNFILNFFFNFYTKINFQLYEFFEVFIFIIIKDIFVIRWYIANFCLFGKDINEIFSLRKHYYLDDSLKKMKRYILGLISTL
jgi:hypothetical protein